VLLHQRYMGREKSHLSTCGSSHMKLSAMKHFQYDPT
jgi:hypothetical protein